MFTGIIETKGIVSRAERVAGGAQFEIYAPDFGRDMAIGDSVAVNGACLTIVSFSRGSFVVDVSSETLERTTLSGVRAKDQVNLERAMRMSDRLGGHMVSGHVDGIATLAQKHSAGNSTIYQFDLPEHLAEYLIFKGSIAIDGISLTIARLRESSIAISVLPLTEQITTLGALRVGDRVNVEIDMIAKYVRKFVAGVSGGAADEQDLDMQSADERLSDKLKGFLERS